MTLMDDLEAVKSELERLLEMEMKDEDFANGRAEILHIYLHEACHAAVSHAVPWIHGLEEGEHTAVDELMVRFLEKEIGESLGLFVHNTGEFMDELIRYPVDISREGYEYLQIFWEDYFWPRRDLEGMATFLLTFLRYGDVVYNLLPKADWERAQDAGVYRPADFTKDGFIHCSKVDQVVKVANAYYSGESDLYLLTIAVDRVGAEIRYEDLLGEGEKFPHIYGPLELKAVIAVSALEEDEQGQFILPTGLSAVDL
jgi:uncharacterized protein (DUF952 family)